MAKHPLTFLVSWATVSALGLYAPVGKNCLLCHWLNHIKTYGDLAFSIAELRQWNNLPLSIRIYPSIAIFKRHLKTYLFKEAYGFQLLFFIHVFFISFIICNFILVFLDLTLQKRAHWKTSPVKIGVPIRLCELKQGFKDYRHLSVPSELWAANLQFFCLTPLTRQYRYNRRINHCFEVSKCRFHRQRLQSVKYLICEMKRIPSWLKHYKQSKRCPSRGTNC